MNPTQEILKLFEQVAAIPRRSMHEQQISRWLQDWAADRGLPAGTDPAGNLVIQVPASAGYENAPTIILQGHLDMVCEKTPDSAHDFSKDPIRCIIDGDWLHADRTTLGADNGLAIALALALVNDPRISHPPLELLFTVQEEIGLGGALHLQKEALCGKILVNLDAETEGVFLVGCAGGQKTAIRLPLSFEPTGDGASCVLKVSGLKGGHSGTDIDKHRANANRVLARLLDKLQRKMPVRIADIKGGTAHNAIPREAQALILLPGEQLAQAQEIIQAFLQTLQQEYAAAEPAISIDLQPGQASRVLNHAASRKVIDLLQALPHGVAEMSASLEGFVETSNNLASMQIEGEMLHIHSSQRSMVMSKLDGITRRIEAVGRLAGAQVETNNGYPAWQPEMDSPLLARSRAVYQELFGKPPRVETIHAGLECGVIGEILGEMDRISLGPTVLDAHSPTERVYIPSLSRVWDFLAALLASYQI